MAKKEAPQPPADGDKPAGKSKLKLIILIVVGLLLAVGGGVALGIICAVWNDCISDFVIMSFAIGGQSMPSFCWGIISSSGDHSPTKTLDSS